MRAPCVRTIFLLVVFFSLAVSLLSRACVCALLLRRVCVWCGWCLLSPNRYEEFNARQADLEGGGSGRGFRGCSCAQVADMVGDVGSLRSAAFAVSTEYAEGSRSIVRAVVDYSVARSRCVLS